MFLKGLDVLTDGFGFGAAAGGLVEATAAFVLGEAGGGNLTIIFERFEVLVGVGDAARFRRPSRFAVPFFSTFTCFISLMSFDWKRDKK